MAAVVLGYRIALVGTKGRAFFSSFFHKGASKTQQLSVWMGQHSLVNSFDR